MYKGEEWRRWIYFSAILLLIIYTTFCDTFLQTDTHLDFLSLISIVFLSEYLKLVPPLTIYKHQNLIQFMSLIAVRQFFIGLQLSKIALNAIQMIYQCFFFFLTKMHFFFRFFIKKNPYVKVPVLIFDNVLAIPVVILQCALLGLIFFITTQPWLDFHPTDTTAMMFCSSHKSLTLG